MPAAVEPLIRGDAVRHANATSGSDSPEMPSSNDVTVFTRLRSPTPKKIPVATTINGNPTIHLPKMPFECRMLRIGYADNMRLTDCLDHLTNDIAAALEVS